MLTVWDDDPAMNKSKFPNVCTADGPWLLPVCSWPLSVTSEAFVNRHGPPPPPRARVAAEEDKRAAFALLTAGKHRGVEASDLIRGGLNSAHGA